MAGLPRYFIRWNRSSQKSSSFCTCTCLWLFVKLEMNPRTGDFLVHLRCIEHPSQQVTVNLRHNCVNSVFSRKMGYPTIQWWTSIFPIKMTIFEIVWSQELCADAPHRFQSTLRAQPLQSLSHRSGRFSRWRMSSRADRIHREWICSMWYVTQKNTYCIVKNHEPKSRWSCQICLSKRRQWLTVFEMPIDNSCLIQRRL